MVSVICRFWMIDIITKTCIKKKYIVLSLLAVFIFDREL